MLLPNTSANQQPPWQCYRSIPLQTRFHIGLQLENGRLVSTLLAVGGKTARWEYSDYQEVEQGQWVPTQEFITITNADNKEISAGLKLTNPSFGESTWRDFEPNDSYNKVSIKDIGNRIKSLTK